MKKEPFVTKAQLDEIIKTYPTPFHLYDEKGIRENMKALKEAFSWNKGYREYFADQYFKRVWMWMRLFFLYRTDAFRCNWGNRRRYHVFFE